MSADNYLYVRKIGEEWTYTMEFASSDPGPVGDHDPRFATQEEAMAAAWQTEQSDYVEYGIFTADEIPTLRALKRADQEAVRDAVNDALASIASPEEKKNG